MDVYKWFLIISSCLIVLTQSQSCKNEPRCKVSRIYKMKGADCFKRDIRKFPQCLASDVEIVDLSVNRIRKIYKSDLEKYSNLKMLYLSDNIIVSIEEDAFDGQSSLNTLDLSLNAISKLPPVVFQLPSLKSLYLSQNLNINIIDVVEQTKPITSPLITLDISYVMSEEPDELPELGVMPYLTKYNISGNKLTLLSTKHFAGLCQLKILDSSNVTAEYEHPCDCWTINNWLSSRKINFKNFECEINESECADSVGVEDLKLYTKCNEKVELLIQQSRILKIVIPIVVVVVLIIIGVIIYVFRRRKQKLRQEKKREINLKNALLSAPDNTYIINKSTMDT